MTFLRRVREDIQIIGVLEISKRTGISRSILHNFAHNRASMKAENLEKVVESLEMEVISPLNVEALKDVDCDPSKKLDILKIAKILKETYAARKVILFGSQVKGTWTRTSDIDFLVVRDSRATNTNAGEERIKTFRAKIKSSYDVVTVADKNLKESLGDKTSVIYSAFQHGVVIYG